MRKTMIRNTAIMAVLSVVLGIVLSLYLRSTFGSPVAGDVYAATANGFSGPIDFEVVVNSGKVTSVTADFSAETEGIGQSAGPQVIDAIVKAGTTEGVDTVSGATLTSKAVLDAVNDCLAQAGTGAASGEVFTSTQKGFGEPMDFEVSIDNGKVTAVKADFSGETEGFGQDAGPKMVDAIVKAGTTEGVDVVSGCTMTSQAVLDAVNDCLAQAGTGAEAPAEDEAAATAEPTATAEPAKDDASASSAEGSNVFTSTKKGFGDPMDFEVTIENGKVTAVKADFSGETAGFGQDAGPKMVDAIVKAGTTEGVDLVSGSTMTSQAVLDAVNDCMAQAGL